MQRYAISRRRALPVHPLGPLSALEQQVGAWAAAGVEWIQIREKDLAPRELCELCHRLAKIVQGSCSRLLLNGLPAMQACDCGAHGVHLPGASSAACVRAAVQAGGAVSVACHTMADVRAAVEGSATVLVWAPVFSKVVDGEHAGPGTGLEALGEACSTAAPMPVFALGGVTPQNASACVAAGAAGAAGIRLFAGQEWRSL